MHRIKYLLKNISLLFIGQFSIKFMSFLLVPIYTRFLSTAEYGTYDVYSTTIGLMIPILTANISDASIRFSLESKYDKNDVARISLRYYFRSIIIFAFILVLNSITNIFPIFNEHPLLLLCLFSIQGLNGILVNLARGNERIKEVVISGVTGTIVTLGLNVFLLVYMRWGLLGYFLANIAGVTWQCLYLSFSIFTRDLLKKRKEDQALRSMMLEYCRPLMVNSLSWWITGVSDRYIVTWLCGVAENGIYSVGYKIPTILSSLQGIFSQAWVLSSTREYDSKDRDDFFSNLYILYNICMVLSCSILICVTKIIAYVLYANEFYLAWRYVPFLLISVVFGALSGYIGGIFAAVKDTKVYATSTLIGAITNIILNIIFIIQIGALGAAFATAISNFIIWIIRLYSIRKYVNLKLIIKRDLLAYTILVMQAFILLATSGFNIMQYVLEVLSIVLLIYIYRSQIERLVREGIRWICSKRFR